MARIPLYEGGAVPSSRTGVRVPIVGQGVAAGPAMGQALVEVGQLGLQFAAKQQQANDTRQVMEAEGVMQQHQAEQRLFQEQNPDQETWFPAWQKRVQDTQDYVSKLKVSAPTREMLNKTAGRWGKLQSVEVEGAAFKTAVGRAKQAVVNRADQAASEGDFQGIRGAILQLPQDFTTPEERQQLQINLEAKAKSVALQQLQTQVGTDLDMRNVEGAKARVQNSPFLSEIDRSAQLARIDATHLVNQQKDQFQAVAIQDPQKALADLQDPEKYKLVAPGDRAQMEVYAKNNLAAQSSDAWRDIQTRISIGQFKPGETFQSIKKLDPLTREVAQIANNNYWNKSSMNSTSEYEAAIAAIDSLQDDGSGLPRAQMEAGIDARFSGPYAEQLKKRLDAKLSNPGASDILKEPLAQLNRWAFDEKRMGEYQSAELGPDGNPIVTEKTIKTAVPGTDSGFLYWRRLPWMGGPVPTVTVTEHGEKQIKPVWKDDPVKRDKIAAEVGRIRMAIEKEAAAGKFTTTEEAMKRMAELAKMPLANTAAGEATARPTPLLPPPNKRDVDLNLIIEQNAKNLRK